MTCASSVPIEIGARFEVTMPVITTTQLVRYAGASDDYNRIHYDQAYAMDEAGLGGVVAHGMLTMAFMSSAATQWTGPSARVRHLDGRFTSPVRPGDLVSVQAAITDVRDDAIDMDLTASVGDRVVAEGRAVVERRAGRSS